MKRLYSYFLLMLMFCNVSLAKSTLPECKGNDITNPIKKFVVAKKWINCYGTQLTPTGKVGYVGEFYKGQPNGNGIFTYAGRSYDGQWKRGKQHGQGTYTYANKDKYIGEWKDGKYYGQGIYIYSNGDKYIGEWKKKKFNKPDNTKGRHGYGTYIYVNGDKYIGEWKKGLRHGKGILKYINGKNESGIWKNDKLK